MPNLTSTAQYVKFVRGTPTAFANLATKNADTLYFISETNATTGKLYLGSKLISGSTDISSIGEIIINNLGDKQILVYDDVQDAWVNSDIKSIIGVMQGATEALDGTSGLVPVPHAGDQNKFLRGDGVWAAPSVPVDPHTFVVDSGNELSLKDFANAPVGTLAQKSSTGNLTWVDTDTILSGVQASINNLQVVVNQMTSSKLQRTKVDSLEDIDPATAPTNVIYMVPNEDASTGNLYSEYMVIDGEIELIGSNYEGDLTGYVTTVQLNTAVGNLNSSISGLDTRVSAIEGNFVPISRYNLEFGDFTQLNTQDNENYTLIDQVNDLTDRLTWYLIDET